MVGSACLSRTKAMLVCVPMATLGLSARLKEILTVKSILFVSCFSVVFYLFQSIVLIYLNKFLYRAELVTTVYNYFFSKFGGEGGETHTIKLHKNSEDRNLML